MTTETTYTPFTVAEIAEEALRLTNCVNGNPRYYISAMMFRRAGAEAGDFYRPKYCRKYTGKRYGAGWVFTSYNLETSISQAIEVAS
jgi:hypothetical protein